MSRGQHQRYRTKPPFLGLLIFGSLCGGCFEQPLLGPLLAAPRSMDRLDESTELRWLTREQLLETPVGIAPQAWRDFVQAQAPAPAASDGRKFLPAMLLPLLPVAAGFAIDDLIAQTRAESTLYVAQFSAQSTTDQFWQTEPSDSARQRIVALELRRTTRASPGDRPACQIVFLFAPASDPRLLIVRPILFCVRSSRAKLFAFDRGLDVHVELSLSRDAIDASGAIAHQTLGGGEFRIGNYDLRGGEPRLLHGQATAIIAAPALTSDPQGKLVNSLVTARAIVTERDAARTDRSFEQLSQHLASERSSLIAATTQPQIP